MKDDIHVLCSPKCSEIHNSKLLVSTKARSNLAEFCTSLENTVFILGPAKTKFCSLSIVPHPVFYRGWPWSHTPSNLAKKPECMCVIPEYPWEEIDM